MIVNGLRERLVVGGDNLFNQRVILERIWNMLDRSHPGGCWFWTGGKNGNGYGQFRTPEIITYLRKRGLCARGQHTKLAHIYVFECFNGSIPEVGDWTLDHREGVCPTRDHLCCNPAHLELVSRSVNSKRCNESNVRPMPVVQPLFDSQHFDRGVLPQTVPFIGLPGRPIYRATRIPKNLLAALHPEMLPEAA